MEKFNILLVDDVAENIYSLKIKIEDGEVFGECALGEYKEK